jgi:hypothetical protein
MGDLLWTFLVHKERKMVLDQIPPERDAEGRFVPGVSGNPRGRPVGSRNRATIAAEVLAAGDREDFAEQWVQLARQGDKTALKFFAERLMPKPRGRPVVLDVPAGMERHPRNVYNMTTRKLCDGEITPSEALEIARYLRCRGDLQWSWTEGEPPRPPERKRGLDPDELRQREADEAREAWILAQEMAAAPAELWSDPEDDCPGEAARPEEPGPDSAEAMERPAETAAVAPEPEAAAAPEEGPENPLFFSGSDMLGAARPPDPEPAPPAAAAPPDEPDRRYFPYGDLHKPKGPPPLRGFHRILVPADDPWAR